MKVWILTVEDYETSETYAFASQEKALETVRQDLADHFHFDTDEPYCSKDELEAIQNAAVESLVSIGLYDSADEANELTYTLDEKEVIE